MEKHKLLHEVLRIIAEHEGYTCWDYPNCDHPGCASSARAATFAHAIINDASDTDAYFKHYRELATAKKEEEKNSIVAFDPSKRTDKNRWWKYDPFPTEGGVHRQHGPKPEGA